MVLSNQMYVPCFRGRNVRGDERRKKIFHPKKWDIGERVRIFGAASSEERWTFFQDKHQNYLDEHQDSLIETQLKALNQAIKYTKTKDRSLEIRADLFLTLWARKRRRGSRTVRDPGNCECSIGWRDSCRYNPIGPVCHLGVGGYPHECVPDIGEPCAEYLDSTMTYCDGLVLR